MTGMSNTLKQRFEHLEAAVEHLVHAVANHAADMTPQRVPVTGAVEFNPQPGNPDSKTVQVPAAVAPHLAAALGALQEAKDTPDDGPKEG